MVITENNELGGNRIWHILAKIAVVQVKLSAHAVEAMVRLRVKPATIVKVKKRLNAKHVTELVK